MITLDKLFNILIIVVCYVFADVLLSILRDSLCSVGLKIPCGCMVGSQLDVMIVFLLLGEKLLTLQFPLLSW